MYVEIARVLRDIGNPKRRLRFCRGSDKPRTQRQHQLLVLTLVGPDHELRPKQPLLLIEKEDRERVIVDLLLDGSRDLANQLINLKRRAHVETDVIEQCEKLAVSPLALIYTRILDRDGDL